MAEVTPSLPSPSREVDDLVPQVVRLPRHLCRAHASCAAPAALSWSASSRLAWADQDAFAEIASTRFDVEAQGVKDLAVSGNARAGAVIDALRDGQVWAWKYPRDDAPLFIKTDKGVGDARTGDPVAAPPPVNLRKVIVNDTVRSAIDSAEGWH